MAKEIELEDTLENMGAQMVKVASKTNDLAGDGTTTATILHNLLLKDLKTLQLEQIQWLKRE